MSFFFPRVLYSTNPTLIDIIYYTHCRDICQGVAHFDFVIFFICSLYNRVKTACLPSKWHSEGGEKHAKTEKNIYLRKDGRWEGRFIKDWIAGKTHYGYVFGKTYEEAERKLNVVSSENVATIHMGRRRISADV